MTSEESEVRLPIKQKVTIGLLGFLLLIRFTDYFWSKSIGGEYIFFYFTVIVFPVLVTVIWLNKDNIQNLQIDKSFLFIFFLSGILLTWIFWDSIGALLTGVGTLIIFELMRTKKFGFGNQNIRLISIFGYTCLGLMPVLLFFSFIDKNIFQFNSIVPTQNSFSFYFISRLWLAAYEEILFRGILYMGLKPKVTSGWRLNLIQGILFWLAHYSYFPGPSFWITIPIVGLWYGFLALRSKSLTPGTITHLIFNILVLFTKHFVE